MPAWKIILIILGVHAIIGILLVEYAFSRLKRIADGNHARDSDFPAFRRRDYKNLSRWRYYPGAMFTLIFRVILIIITCCIVISVAYLMRCCHDKRKPLPDGKRLRIVNFAYKYCSFFYVFFGGVIPTKRNKDFDYSKWLGPEYKQKYKNIKKTSTFIMNHVSFMDAQAFGVFWPYSCTMLEAFKNAPIMG